jgi:hypothetical protein
MPEASRCKSVTLARSARIAALCAVALILSLATPPVRAENVNEFKFPEAQNLSRQASSQLLNSIGMTFRALAAAEQGNRDSANGLKREALSILEAARADFGRVKNEMKRRTIDLGRAPPTLNNIPIQMIFQQRGYPVPRDTAELADIALREAERYNTVLQALDFGDPNRSRPAVLRLNDQLHRLMALGVAISQLADAST